eukprot:g6319.t1
MRNLCSIHFFARRCFTSWVPNPTLKTEPLAQTVWRTAQELGDRSFLTSHHQRETLSFTDFFERSSSFAAVMDDEMYLSEGDIVALWLPNCIENAVIQLAASQIGVAVATVKDEKGLEKAFKDWGGRCKCVIVSDEDVKVARRIAVKANAPAPTIVVEGAYGYGGRAAAEGDMPRLDGDEEKLKDYNDPEIDDDADGASQLWKFTECLPEGQWMVGGSGARTSTLGFYNSLKGFSQKELQEFAFNSREKMELSTDDVLHLPVTLNHPFGIANGLIAGLSCGASICLPGPGGDPIENAKATLKSLRLASTADAASRNVLLGDTHTLKALQKIMDEEEDDKRVKVRTGLIKIGSGDNIENNNKVTFAGTPMLTVGKAKE